MTGTVTTNIEVIARLLILTPGGALVVRQRGKNWGFLLGGHVEHGETAVDSAIRELREEIGLTLAPEVIERAGVVEHAYTEDGEYHHEINVVFTATLDSDHIPSSLEDHLETLIVPMEQFGDFALRPAPLKDALLGWLANRTPFFSPLPATAG
ncbi:MAG: NUDIX domain-containing protein [Pseudonocardiaceae bacterium]